MLTATKDKLLPTTVTGSWPRPSWYRNNTHGERFAHCMTDTAFREQFQDATAVVISDQERAGLDILTNGDYHLDPETAGRSWLHYPLDRIGGLSPDEFLPPSEQLYEYPRGTLLNEIFTNAWMWPLAGLLNAELRRLAAAGCTVIQIEEPAIHAVAAADPGHPDLGFLIDAFNYEVDGLDGVEIWAHTCWGNPNMQRVYRARSYAASVEIFMERLHIDVWTIESKDNGQEALPHLARYRDTSRVKIALGVVSHRDLTADTPDQVADEIRRALDYVAPQNLILSSDCGFGREGCPRNIALYKAAGIAQGANIVRRELGSAATRVRIAEDLSQNARSAADVAAPA